MSARPAAPSSCSGDATPEGVLTPEGLSISYQPCKLSAGFEFLTAQGVAEAAWVWILNCLPFLGAYRPPSKD